MTQTTEFYALLLRAGSQTTQLPAISFEVRPQDGGPVQPVYMVEPLTGSHVLVGDKIRAWGVLDRDQGVLRAWRVEVWERNGLPASEIITTPRPFPLLLVSAMLMGLVLLSCLCSVLTR